MLISYITLNRRRSSPKGSSQLKQAAEKALGVHKRTRAALDAGGENRRNPFRASLFIRMDGEKNQQNVRKIGALVF